MSAPSWFTNAGLLAIYPDLVAITPYQLEANYATSYTLVSGELPDGLVLSIDGLITGSPSAVTIATATSTFTVRASNTQGFSDRTFSISIFNWITAAGSLNTYPALIQITPYQLLTTGISVTYQLISGELPPGLALRSDGQISGTPEIVTQNTTNTFVVRATETSTGILVDRTFTITISGQAIPSFITASGTLVTTLDSIWQEIPIEYNNPVASNPVIVRVTQGILPPGLEINEYGLIRGYPEPPVSLRNFPVTNSQAISTNSTTNYITATSTYNFYPGRAITFSGLTLGGIAPGTYYVKKVISGTQFQISLLPGGNVYPVTTDTSVGTFLNLPATQVNDPTKRQYSFTLQLYSPLGTAERIFSITVVNFYLPTSQGGPNPTNPDDTRLPTIFNTQPPTYKITADQDNYGYYMLPPDSEVAVPGMTYTAAETAYMGQFTNGDYMEFRFLGYDFDRAPDQQDTLTYSFTNLPAGLTGNTVTGWIYGIPPNVDENTIEEFTFQVSVFKTADPTIASQTYNYGFRVANNITGIITWITDSDLGTIYNASTCYKSVVATSDVELEYSMVGGSLPPNLEITSAGDIQGIVAYQPTDNFQELDQTATYTFTVRATYPASTIVYSERTFTLTVKQYYEFPTDNLYIQCMPSDADRNLLRTLLDNETYIPSDYIYRPTDPNFGKATSVVYAHAYGIFSSTVPQYIASITRNHYWRNIILGAIKTAQARDTNGDIVYEVVYSNVIDNLEAYNPGYDYDYRYSVSIPEQINWPRPIPTIQPGFWFDTAENIFTSYIGNAESIFLTNLRQYDMEIQAGPILQIQQTDPYYYTSRLQNTTYYLYPNSLENMRKRVSQELGANYNFRLLPLWMSSQQSDGNTLGFTPAWVIAYTKPPVIKTAVATNTYDVSNTIELDNVDNLQKGGKVVFSGNTIGGIVAKISYYVVDIDTILKTITVSTTPGGNAMGLSTSAGEMLATFEISYADIIKNNINNGWSEDTGYTLNQINFEIDRFTVDKQITWNYDRAIDPAVWTGYPSATPTPDPIDSENFYVLFPQRTIIPITPE